MVMLVFSVGLFLSLIGSLCLSLSVCLSVCLSLCLSVSLSVSSFCVELKSTDRVQLLTKWLPDYMAGLCDLGSSSHEDVVFIIVDCLQMVARVSECVLS